MTDKGGATKHTLPRRFDRFVGTASVLAVYTKHFLSRRSARFWCCHHDGGVPKTHLVPSKKSSNKNRL